MNLFSGTWREFASAAAVYFAILDPFFCTAIFAAAAAHVAPSQRPRQALLAVGVALAVLVVFAVGGTHLLALFTVSLTGLKLGGGLVLLILGIQTVLQRAFTDIGEPGRASPGVLIGSPVLAGPGAILHTLIVRQAHGLLFPLAAAGPVLLVCYGAMRSATWIGVHVADHWVELFSRIMGLLLVAYSAEMILTTVLQAATKTLGGP